MAAVLQGNWTRTIKSMSNSHRAESKIMSEAFVNAVLQMWPAYSVNSTMNNGTTTVYNKECIEHLTARIHMITSITRSNKNPFENSVVSFSSYSGNSSSGNGNNSSNPSSIITTTSSLAGGSSTTSTVGSTSTSMSNYFGMGTSTNNKGGIQKLSGMSDSASSLNMNHDHFVNDNKDGQLLLAFHTKEIAFGIEDS